MLGGDKCKATIVDVASRNGGYVVGGVQVRKKHLSLKLTIVNIIQHMVVYSKNLESKKLEKKSLFIKRNSMVMKFLKCTIIELRL